MPIPPKKQEEKSHLGFGIRFPLVREGGDFGTAESEDLVMSTVPFILLTNSDGPFGQGEIPWDTEFGSQLQRLKFTGLGKQALLHVTKHHVVDSLFKCEPRLLVSSLEIEERRINNKRSMTAYVGVIPITEDVEGNDVRFQGEKYIPIDLTI